MSVWQAGVAPLVVGHRGGRGPGWPAENTLPAFEQARAQGALAIELDVRTCAGGDVVVFHDDDLERMTGGRDRRAVADVPLAELRTIDIGGGATMPTLAEVLAWAKTNALAVNVELKHQSAHRFELARGTARVILASGVDVIASSFDPLLVALVGAVAPAIPRALLTQTAKGRLADAMREVARPVLVHALHIERTQSDDASIARYRGRGLCVGVWTVNDPVEARRLATAGANFIVTDTAGAIRHALGQ